MPAKPPVHVTVTGAAGQIGYSLLFRGSAFGAAARRRPADRPAAPRDRARARRTRRRGHGDRRLRLPPGDRHRGHLGSQDGVRRDLVGPAGRLGAPQGRHGAGRPPQRQQGDPQAPGAGPSPRKDKRRLRRAHPGGGQPLQHQLPHRPFQRPRGPRRALVRHKRASTRTEPKAQLAHKAGAPVAAVTNVAIWGNHSATRFPRLRQRQGRRHAGHRGDHRSRVAAGRLPDHGARAKRAAIDYGARVVLGRLGRRGRHRHRGLLAHQDGAGRLRLGGRGQFGAVRRTRGSAVRFPVAADGKGNWSVVKGFVHDDLAKERIAVTTEELQGERSDVQGLGLIA